MDLEPRVFRCNLVELALLVLAELAGLLAGSAAVWIALGDSFEGGITLAEVCWLVASLLLAAYFVDGARLVSSRMAFAVRVDRTGLRARTLLRSRGGRLGAGA